MIDHASLHIYNEADTKRSSAIIKKIQISEWLEGVKVVPEDEYPEDDSQEGGDYGDDRGSGKGASGNINETHVGLDKKGVTGHPEEDTGGPEGDGEVIILDKEVIEEPDFMGTNETVSKKDSETSGGKTSQDDVVKSGKVSPGSTKHDCEKTAGCGGREGMDGKALSKTQSGEEGVPDSSKQGSKNHEAPVGEEIELLTKNIFLSSKSWFRINLKEVIIKWTQREQNNTFVHALKFMCNNCQSSLKICSKSRYRPFVVIKITEKKQRSERKRRSYAVNCAPGYEKCCRRRLYVNFKEIKWQDWIIEPAGFEVNYCEGRCTGTGVLSARSHAYVKQRLMGNNKHSYLTVCCVPVKFSSLTLLHYDEEGLIHKTVLKNMTVEKCGCV